MSLVVYSEVATPTAILGNPELLTAVAIGVLVLGETFTNRLIFGILLILFAVVMVVFRKELYLRAVRHALSRLRR